MPNDMTAIVAPATNIYGALAAAQAEMGKAIKAANNPHFRSKYADLGAVVDACLPALNAHGIALFQPAVTVEGERYVRTVLAHGASGTTIECDVPLILGKNDMQGYGAAVTYARRYGLMAMAGIAPEDDDGNAAAASAPKQAARPRNEPRPAANEAEQIALDSIGNTESLDALKAIWVGLPKDLQTTPRIQAAKDVAKTRIESAADADAIPY